MSRVDSWVIIWWLFRRYRNRKKKWCSLPCSKIQTIRRCQGNGINTDCSKIFFCLFPLDTWKCCLRSFGTFVVRYVVEMMSLQVLYVRVLAGEPQHLDWMVWDGKFRVASRTVILTSLPTIRKHLRMSANPARHMQSWDFNITSASKMISTYIYGKTNALLWGVLIVKLWHEMFREYSKPSPV